jgi:putative transposase
MPYWRLFYHLVWATRDRQPLIVPELRPELDQLLIAAARKNGILVHAVGGIEDHVHMAVSIPPALSVANAVGRLKGSSARALNRQPGGGFGWQTEYGAVSFAERHLPRVVAYVTDQPHHHANNTLWPMLEHVGGRGAPDSG